MWGNLWSSWLIDKFTQQVVSYEKKIISEDISVDKNEWVHDVLTQLASVSASLANISP